MHVQPIRRMPARWRRRALVLLPMLVLASAGATWAAFSSQTDNTGNSIAAASDYVPPTVSPLAVIKSQNGATGYIKQGGTYYVYGNATDTGNPASGVASVTADVSNLTTGQTSAAMASGSWTVGGQTYNRRSAQLTANAVLAAGAMAFTVTATDSDSNSGNTNGSVTVDNTAPTATDVQGVNVAAGQAGQAESGDTLTYTFSEDIEPESVLAGWTGGAQSVTVRFNNVGTADTVTIYNQANTAPLPYGTVALNGNYVTANRTIPSTMTMAGTTVQFVFGTPSGAMRKENTADAMVWTPSTTPYDRAANATAATSATEATPLDVEF